MDRFKGVKRKPPFFINIFLRGGLFWCIVKIWLFCCLIFLIKQYVIEWKNSNEEWQESQSIANMCIKANSQWKECQKAIIRAGSFPFISALWNTIEKIDEIFIPSIFYTYPSLAQIVFIFLAFLVLYEIWKLLIHNYEHNQAEIQIADYNRTSGNYICYEQH